MINLLILNVYIKYLSILIRDKYIPKYLYHKSYVA